MPMRSGVSVPSTVTVAAYSTFPLLVEPAAAVVVAAGAIDVSSPEKLWSSSASARTPAFMPSPTIPTSYSLIEISTSRRDVSSMTKSTPAGAPPSETFTAVTVPETGAVTVQSRI